MLLYHISTYVVIFLTGSVLHHIGTYVVLCDWCGMISGTLFITPSAPQLIFYFLFYEKYFKKIIHDEITLKKQKAPKVLPKSSEKHWKKWLKRSAHSERSQPKLVSSVRVKTSWEMLATVFFCICIEGWHCQAVMSKHDRVRVSGDIGVPRSYLICSHINWPTDRYRSILWFKCLAYQSFKLIQMTFMSLWVSYMRSGYGVPKWLIFLIA